MKRCGFNGFGIYPRHKNHASGTANAKPINRPQSRWIYSHQKIILNSDIGIPAFSSRYSDVWRYKSKIRDHSASEKGGRTPMKGRHSTIDRPDSVSLVIAPISIISATISATARSQARIARPAFESLKFFGITVRL